MKKPIPNRPVFDPANRTLDFSSTPNFEVRRLFGVLHIKTGQLIYSPIVPELVAANIAGSVLTLKFNTNGMTPADALFIEYDDGITDLPADAARESKQDTGIARLTEIRDAVRAQRVETIWTDDTGTRFIRQNNEGVISWTDVAGTASAAPGTGARPDSDSGLVVSRSPYVATAAGTGFSVGDYLDHFVVSDGDAGDLVSNFWINATVGTKIAAPSSALITPLATLPNGAATSAKQDTGITSLAAIAAGIGAPADTAPASDTASGSVVARLARLLATQTGISTVITAIRDRLPTALVSGRLSVDGSGVTQPVSATTLPLPTGAATSANQATEISALGAPADAAYGGTGSSSIIAALKAIYAALIAPTPAGTNAIGSVSVSNRGQIFVEAASGTAVAAGANQSGATRDLGGLSGAYAKFNAVVFPTAAGTLYIQQSNDGTTWYTTGQVGANAGQTTTLSNGIVARYSRALFANGGAANSLALFNASFTAV